MNGCFDEHLRAVAARICDADAMARVIDPTLDDFRLECDEALGPWRRIWLHLAVVGALVQVITVCVFERCFVSSTTCGTEPGSLGRVITRCMIATVAALVLFIWPPLAAVASTLGWRIVILIVPQAIPIAVPIGLTLGVFCSAQTARTSPKVARQTALIAAIGAVASFIIFSWIIPAANQAFRESAFQHQLKARGEDVVHHQPLAKGENELTIGELREQASTVSTQERTGRLVRFLYYQRWAVPAATLVMTIFALAWVRHSLIGAAAGSAVAVSSVLIYALLMAAGRVHAVDGTWGPATSAWLPNTVFATLTVVLTKRTAGSRAPI
jgi:hypothetical protein